MTDARRTIEKIAMVALAGKIAERRAVRSDLMGWVRHRTPAEIISIHESSHTIIARHLAFSVYSASIVPGESSAGRVVFGIKPEQADKPGEELADHQQVARYCWIMCDPRGWRQALALVRTLRAQASELVEELWPQIIEFSRELQNRRELSQSEIAEFMRARCSALAE